MDRVTNLLIEEERIAAFDVEPDKGSTNGSVATIDAAGKLVARGLIDMHA